MKRKHDGISSSKPKKAIAPKAPVVNGTKTFGEKFKEDWLTRNHNINYDYTIMWTETCERQTGKTRLETILQKSREFPIPFPVVDMRCVALKNKISIEQLEKNINSTYPLVHEKTLELYIKFMKFKCEFGSNVEKKLYKDMNVVQLVQRLLDLRAVSFWGRGDKYLLMSKHKGMSKWATIGTDEEKPPLTLNKVISYHEVKLSALLYVSGYTQFINNGLRQNAGIPADKKEDIEESGIIIGLVGTRLCKKQVMEYEEIIVTKEQNNPKNGYGPLDETASSEQIKKQKWRQLWADFYEEPNNLYTDVLQKMKEDENHFSPARAKNAYFDNSYYKKRMCLTIDTLLFEVNERARKAKKMAYIHMVGIGLGLWRNANHQGSVVLDVFAQRLRYLKNHTHHISDVHFAYFKCDEGTDEIKDNDLFEDKNHHSGGIKIHISNREPSAKLRGEHNGKLLIQTYAWDGNAQPGNEFWFGKLKTSGDSAAACSSQVSELHNSHINSSNVCGSNLRVVSRKHGLLHIADYAKVVQGKK